MEPQTSSSAEHVYRRYLDLADEDGFDAQLGLGGRLVYAGELAANFSLLRAANIAGAASLAASADAAIQRQAIREGMADFLVTSLDEALRILKNELRKRQPVSVGVSLEPAAIAAQMLERGVLPDLLGAVDAEGEFLQQGARSIPKNVLKKEHYLQWSVDRDFFRWMPLLDDCARSVFSADDALRQRWLRLAPRYLGREAQRIHGVAMDPEEAVRFREAVKQMLAREVSEHVTSPSVSIDA